MEDNLNNSLNILAVIGFNGTTLDGLILHPDNETLIFPIGNQIIVRNVLSRQDKFLRGHTNEVSTLCISNSGKYLASGQKTFSGFKADIIIWELETGSLLHRLSIHKFLIQSMCFSFNEAYLASLGGVEDNYLIVWDVQSGKALCGNTAGTDAVHQVKFFNTADDQFVTCQNAGIRIWKVDYILKKLRPIDVNFGNLKRNITCMCLDSLDNFGYFGTKTGDILEIDLKNAIYKRIGPMKKLFPQGIKVLKMLPNSDIMVGTGEGVLAKIGFSDMKIKCETKLLGGISSISLTAESAFFFCGTDESNIYWCESSTLNSEIRNTCHRDRINDIRFPYEYSGVFGTCSKNDIRIWNSETRQEHLRIHVPNLECFCFGFMRDGKSIYSGWHDGKIRSFLPQSGKLFYCISDAHINGVTAITSTSDNLRLISGGMSGEIRVWKITQQKQIMEASLKEHRGRVWSIIVNSLNDRAVSASADGSCIIWDIKMHTRLACMFETTMFKQLVYHPDESQLLTTGTNKKITYWDAVEAIELRMIDGSLEGEVNTLAMTKSGEYFISGGEDKEVKIWEYDTAKCKWQGFGHSNTISRLQISPNQEFIVSVGDDGSIFLYETPMEIRLAKVDQNKPK